MSSLANLRFFSMRMRFFHPQRTPRDWPWSESMWISSAHKMRICHFVQFKTKIRTNCFRAWIGAGGKKTSLIINFCLWQARIATEIETFTWIKMGHTCTSYIRCLPSTTAYFLACKFKCTLILHNTIVSYETICTQIHLHSCVQF